MAADGSGCLEKRVMGFHTCTRLACCAAIALAVWHAPLAAQSGGDGGAIDAFVVIDRASLLPGDDDIELRWHVYRQLDERQARTRTDAYVFETTELQGERQYCARIEPAPRCRLAVDGRPPQPAAGNLVRLVSGGFLDQVPGVSRDQEITLHFEVQIDDPRYRDISRTIRVHDGTYGEAWLTIKSVIVLPPWMEWWAKVQRIGWVGIPLAICLLLSLIAAIRLLWARFAYRPGHARRVAADTAVHGAAHPGGGPGGHLRAPDDPALHAAIHAQLAQADGTLGPRWLHLLRTEILMWTAGVAPLLGLFGTVLGIRKGMTPLAGSRAINLGQLAELGRGIEEAVLTTIVGLLIGIASLLCFLVARHWLAGLRTAWVALAGAGRLRSAADIEDVDKTPLVDIVFVLLIFFVVAALIPGGKGIVVQPDAAVAVPRLSGNVKPASTVPHLEFVLAGSADLDHLRERLLRIEAAGSDGCIEGSGDHRLFILQPGETLDGLVQWSLPQPNESSLQFCRRVGDRLPRLFSDSEDLTRVHAAWIDSQVSSYVEATRDPPHIEIRCNRDLPWGCVSALTKRLAAAGLGVENVNIRALAIPLTQPGAAGAGGGGQSP